MQHQTMSKDELTHSSEVTASHSCLYQAVQQLSDRSDQDNPTPVDQVHDRPHGSASTAVAQTYELLEAILSELPLTNIVNLRRVNKTFDSVIQTSLPIRLKVGTPEPRGQAWVWDRHGFQEYDGGTL